MIPQQLQAEAFPHREIEGRPCHGNVNRQSRSLQDFDCVQEAGLLCLLTSPSQLNRVIVQSFDLASPSLGGADALEVGCADVLQHSVDGLQVVFGGGEQDVVVMGVREREELFRDA